jgi:hypothetical protein
MRKTIVHSFTSRNVGVVTPEPPDQKVVWARSGTPVSPTTADRQQWAEAPYLVHVMVRKSLTDGSSGGSPAPGTSPSSKPSR